MAHVATLSNGSVPFQDDLMRHKPIVGNGLRNNRCSSRSAIRRNQRHIGPYACVRNRTMRTGKCFEPLHLEYSDDRRPQHCALEGPRTNNPSGFPGHNSDYLHVLTCKVAGKPGKSIRNLAGFGRFFEGLDDLFIVLGGDVAGAQEGGLPWLVSIEPNRLLPSSGLAKLYVRPLFWRPHKPTSVGSPGFDDCADSLGRRWVCFEGMPARGAGFVRAQATPSDSRPPAPRSRGRTSSASSCRPMGAFCSSAVARRPHRRKCSRLGRSRQPRSDADDH
jgi:hypothetical protein